MSNHEIGHAMDTIIENILDLYDEGAFSAGTVRKLIKTALHVVDGYDGNGYEALETMTYTHCGSCLKKYAENEPFIVENDAANCVELNDKLDWDWWYTETEKTGCVGLSLCMDCFYEIFQNVLSPELMERIVKNASKTSQDRENPSYIW